LVIKRARKGNQTIRTGIGPETQHHVEEESQYTNFTGNPGVKKVGGWMDVKTGGSFRPAQGMRQNLNMSRKQIQKETETQNQRKGED